MCLKCLVDIPRLRSDGQLTYVGVPSNTIRIISWFSYNHDDPSHRLIHAIKYHDGYRLARRLGREFADQKAIGSPTPDILLPIPLHRIKYVARGYNQSARIAAGISDVTGIPVGSHLYAKKAHASQTQRNRHERLENVRDIFGVRKAATLDGKHIALVDDVITTGATMISALETILAASSPASVTFLSLARANQL